MAWIAAACPSLDFASCDRHNAWPSGNFPGKIQLKEGTAMRVFRICSCLLLFAPLLGIVGCGGSSAYVKKGPEVKTNTVKVSNCKADPDTVQVAKNDPLIWTVDPPDGHTYSIKFPHARPVSSSTVPIGQTQTVTGDGWCNSLGGIINSLCVYPYQLIQDGATTCPDPGVHVVPRH